MNFLSILSRFYILALQLDLKSMFSNGAGSESLLVRYLWLVYVLCAYHWFILQRERAAIFLTTNYITIALYIEDQVQRVLTEIYLKKFEIKMGTKLEKLFIFRTQLVWSQGSPFCWDAEAAGPAMLGQNLSKISASQPNLSKISASDQKSSL